MKHLIQGLTIVATSTLLFACASQGGIQNDQTNACADNPFLQKYNCSIDQVEQAAERGEPDAEYALGYMYYYGIDTAQDTQTAAIWIKRAAAQGQPLAIKAAKLMGKQSYPTQGSATMHPHHGVVNHHAEYHPAKHHAVSHHLVSHHAFSAAIGNIAAVPASHYTLQVMGSRDAARVKGFASKHHLGDRAATYNSTFKGGPWTVLIYGNYSDMNAAEVGKHHLPAALKGMHPWVKSYRAVHEEMKR